MKMLRSHPGNSYNFLHDIEYDITWRCLGSIHHLGEPIKEHGFDLTDSEHNFCYGNKAQFEVSVKGPKDKGKMFFWAERAESKEWIVTRLELELKSIPDKRLIVQKAD